MPAQVNVVGESLVVRMEGADKFWAFASRLEIPLVDVVDAEPAGDEARGWPGFKAGGTYIPGVLHAGRFRKHGRLVFWDVHKPDKAIVIALRHEHYDKLIIEVDDPEGEVARIREAATTVAR
jgi:hypothetical protein